GRKFFYRDKQFFLPKSILVVGGNAGAGARTVAKMLARYMARTYTLRVLLIDAHLAAFTRTKAPDQERDQDEAVTVLIEADIADPCETTLSDWLLDRRLAPDPAKPGEVRTLGAGPGGTVPRGAMLRLVQEDLSSLGDFDTIIFDAPPLIADSVTHHLASLAEATIPVVRLEHTRKGVLQSMNDDLTMSGASVMGVVCNRRRFYIPQWIYKRLS
ncbi:MAG: hypothetical protein LBS30_00895, partial [Planctomycetota bacterium]|nr:hypothetical protein [Planctomycetota bacterium]